MRQSKGGCDAQGKAPAGGNQTTEFEYRERERERERERKVEMGGGDESLETVVMKTDIRTFNIFSTGEA